MKISNSVAAKHRAANISVVICAHTEERWVDLLEAIASVQAQTVAPLETVVVIDHNPGLLQRLQALNLAGVTSIENSGKRGLSGARNTGIEQSGGEFIAFLDDDAVAETDWIEQLVGGYSDPQVLGIGGAILPMWLQGNPGWFPTEFNWVVGCTYTGMPQTKSPVRNLIGCNMSLRREVFDKVGGFKSDLGRLGKYPAGCEETELCIRAGQRFPGHTFLYEPAARVAHRVPAARGQFKYFRARCYAEGLSKALVARHVGQGDGLSSERDYVRRTLPAGVKDSLNEALHSHKVDAMFRAMAIVAGLAFTTTGYLVGTIQQKVAHWRMKNKNQRAQSAFNSERASL